MNNPVDTLADGANAAWDKWCGHKAKSKTTRAVVPESMAFKVGYVAGFNDGLAFALRRMKGESNESVPSDGQS